MVPALLDADPWASLPMTTTSSTSQSTPSLGSTTSASGPVRDD